jgi:hypothetical protein
MKFFEPFLSHLAGVSILFGIKNVSKGDRCVKGHLSSKSDNFQWSLVLVYGSTKDAHKSEFSLYFCGLATMKLYLCWYVEISILFTARRRRN